MRRIAVAVAVVSSLLVASRAHAQDRDALYTCHVPPAGTKVSVSFKPDTEVRDLAVWVSGFTCKNVVFGAELARCAARVDIISPVEMTPKQAVALFVDALDAVGLVATIKQDTIIIKPGKDAALECTEPAEPPSTPATPSTPDPLPPDPSAPDQQVKGWPGIVRLDDTHATVTRALVEQLRADPTPLMKGARIVPSLTDGKPDGFKLYAIRPGSIYAQVGIANGDKITAVNGAPALPPDQAEAAVEKASHGDRFVLGLVRRGKPMTLTITIVP
jgi:general secretion pathway protein C